MGMLLASPPKQVSRSCIKEIRNNYISICRTFNNDKTIPCVIAFIAALYKCIIIILGRTYDLTHSLLKVDKRIFTK